MYMYMCMYMYMYTYTYTYTYAYTYTYTYAYTSTYTYKYTYTYTNVCAPRHEGSSFSASAPPSFEDQNEKWRNRHERHDRRENRHDAWQRKPRLIALGSGATLAGTSGQKWGPSPGPCIVSLAKERERHDWHDRNDRDSRRMSLCIFELCVALRPFFRQVEHLGLWRPWRPGALF